MTHLKSTTQRAHDTPKLCMAKLLDRILVTNSVFFSYLIFSQIESFQHHGTRNRRTDMWYVIIARWREYRMKLIASLVVKNGVAMPKHNDIYLHPKEA